MHRHVLIAGCGDIGLRVARRLRERGVAVTGLRRSRHALPQGITALAADLTEPRSLQALPTGITEVVCVPTPDARTESCAAIFPAGLANLLHALETTALRRRVLVSSSAIYGGHAKRLTGRGVHFTRHCVDNAGMNGARRRHPC